MAHTSAIGALLLGLSLVLLGPGASAQNPLQLGGCPSSYITTFDFDARKISELIGSTGFQTIMTQGTGVEENHTCQKLQLFEGTSFSYSFMDADGEKHQVSGRYRAIPTSFKNQGFLELFGLPNGVLGANIFGTAHLFPLVSRADAHVYLSCSQLGFFYSENVYIFVPNTPSSLRGAEDVSEALTLMGVPYSKSLKRSDQSCVKVEKPANASSSDAAVSNASPNNTVASDASSSSALASNASSSDASASDAPSSSTSAPVALASDASSSRISAPVALASDASSSSASASDAASSDVLPSGASSNDALDSVASSIDALASDALSSGASSSTVPAASSPAKDNATSSPTQ